MQRRLEGNGGKGWRAHYLACTNRRGTRLATPRDPGFMGAEAAWRGGHDSQRLCLQVETVRARRRQATNPYPRHLQRPHYRRIPRGVSLPVHRASRRTAGRDGWRLQLCTLAEFNSLLNQRVCKIGPHPEELDLDFLTLLLPGYLRAIHDVTSSTTVTHLSSRDVARSRFQCLRLPNSTNSPGCSQQQHLSSTRVQATLRLLDERSSASGKPSSPLPARAALPLTGESQIRRRSP